MLVLSGKDFKELMTPKEMNDAIEQAFIVYEQRRFTTQTRSQLSLNENALLVMPSANNHHIVTKIVSVFPHNQSLPVTQGMIIITDGINGEMKAILDGTLLTGMRTGAIGGIAVRHLAPYQATSLGLIGTGEQGLHQLISCCSERTIQNIYLYNRSPEKIPAFINQLKKYLPPSISIHTMTDSQQVVEKSDIIITATASTTPVLPNVPNIYENKLIIAIGSFQPHMRELPDTLLQEAEILYVDTIDAIEESGDIIDPISNGWISKANVVPFSKVITHSYSKESNHHKPIIFKSTGHAVFDLIAAEAIYQKAIQHQIGHTINL
ncbi:ornithine cyclodeaminase family protein [Bacillus massiliigorillae]|uniref:ornithine cyclodeaminase family protein n=1 Tax=Bacillus massiliigorillae TaxID=1243664 RepID=UPI000399E7EE|nr:ornithine cyclodeaminase family protein [Bacillus massiliigorillae]